MEYGPDILMTNSAGHKEHLSALVVELYMCACVCVCVCVLRNSVQVLAIQGEYFFI